MGQIDLSTRYREILVALVRQFIASGFPVGSRLGNAIADPNQSGDDPLGAGGTGRWSFPGPPAHRRGIPTEKAYRFYVDRVVRGAHLTPDTEQ